jgi:hypothetical protein
MLRRKRPSTPMAPLPLIHRGASTQERAPEGKEGIHSAEVALADSEASVAHREQAASRT